MGRVLGPLHPRGVPDSDRMNPRNQAPHHSGKTARGLLARQTSGVYARNTSVRAKRNMKLQTKTSLIVGSIFAASCLLVLGLFHQVILREFKILEIRQSRRNMARLQEALQQSVRALIDHSKDWGWWEEVYAFVDHPSPQFIEDNLTYQTIAPLGFRHIGFLNSRLELVHGIETDNAQEEVTQLSGVVKSILVETKVFKNVLSNGNEDVGAFATMGGKTFIVAASPIKRDGAERTNGVIFITREVDAAFLDKIKQMTKVDFIANADGRDTRPSREAASLITEAKAFSGVDLREQPEQMLGFSTVHDLAGQPFLSLEASFPRDIYRNAVATERFFGGMFLVIFAASGTAIVLLMRTFVVSPVRRLGSTLQEITVQSDFGGRVEVQSSDEIGALGRKINETLGTLQHALGVAEQAQHVAEAANRSKSSFIAKVSHELRTPIHSITGMLRILLKEERSSAKRNYIMMARNSAYGLLETINEILDFSKAEANKLTLETIEFNPHEVIREALQTVGPRVEEQGSLDTIVEICQGIPDKVYGDPLRLRQVLVNLLGNATKFTKEGHIGLKVNILETDGPKVLLEMRVFDTGVGIPEDRLERIFEPFGQADESMSRRFTGTGLGLTIVKQFVEAMNGTVAVESTLGIGSQFILTIPFESCPDARPVICKPTLNQSRVALIDRQRVAIGRLASGLRETGYEPEIFSSDDSASLEELANNVARYGLLIVTSEALKRSRVFDLIVNARTRDTTPIVAILSPFEISVRERLIALEVPFVVTRPISLLEILGVVSGDISPNSEAWDDAEDTFLHAERPLEILVADDAATNRIILTELLRDAGHHVVCVENGVEMVARVRESLEGARNAPRFDLVLTDVQMPLLDGLSATSQIRELEKELGASQHLPIVAVTAHAMTEETSRMRQFGVDDVVTKPLDPLKLGDVIQRLTRQRGIPSPEEAPQHPATPSLSLSELTELAARLWRQVARRKSDVRELFGLGEDPCTPEELRRVLDVADVMDRSGDSVRRTLLIFRGFLDCFREQVVALGHAKHSGDLGQIQFASHALKGLLLDVGAHISGELASSIERDCKKGDFDLRSPSIAQLTKQTLMVSRLVAQITRLVESGARGNPSENAIMSQNSIAQVAHDS